MSFTMPCPPSVSFFRSFFLLVSSPSLPPLPQLLPAGEARRASRGRTLGIENEEKTTSAGNEKKERRTLEECFFFRRPSTSIFSISPAKKGIDLATAVFLLPRAFSSLSQRSSCPRQRQPLTSSTLAEDRKATTRWKEQRTRAMASPRRRRRQQLRRHNLLLRSLPPPPRPAGEKEEEATPPPAIPITPLPALLCHRPTSS